MSTGDEWADPGGELALLDALADAWDQRDPLPAGAVDRILVALAVADLDSEYEILHLISRTRDLAGTRSDESETLTFVFSDEHRSLMMRIGPLDDGRRRIDGWVTPPQPGTVRLEQGAVVSETVADDLGRFEWVSVARSASRLVFVGRSGTALATPFFDL